MMSNPNFNPDRHSGHIDAVLGRYGDRLAHMDVVNERELSSLKEFADR